MGCLAIPNDFWISSKSALIPPPFVFFIADFITARKPPRPQNTLQKLPRPLPPTSPPPSREKLVPVLVNHLQSLVAVGQQN